MIFPAESREKRDDMYTFARWVTTPENRPAEAAVRRVAECVCSGRARREVNPLFLHGPPGTGKTHLTAALAADVANNAFGLTVATFPADELGALLAAREGAPGAPDDAAESLLRSNLLIVEDLQHLPSRHAGALARVLDERVARQQQVVCTATAGPARLAHLPARLTSRLAGGLVVGLQPFTRAGRLAFLKDRTERRQVAVGADVLAWLADNVSGSGRQLEGAVRRLENLTRAHDRFPDLATVTAHFRDDAAPPTVERIAERVGRYFRVEPRHLVARRRTRTALLPRQVGMYLARRLTPLSLQEIGAFFGGRDHSTVLHACRKVEEALAHDAGLSGAVRQLHADLE